MSDETAPLSDLITYPGRTRLKERNTQQSSRLLALPAELFNDIMARLPDSSLVAVAQTSVQGYESATKQYPARFSLCFDASRPDPEYAFLAPGHRNQDAGTKNLVRVLTYACKISESDDSPYQDSEAFWIERGNPTASTHLGPYHSLLTPRLQALHIVMTESEKARDSAWYRVCPQVGIVGKITDKAALKTVTAEVSPGFCDSFWTVFPQLEHKGAQGSIRCNTLIVQDTDSNSPKKWWTPSADSLGIVSKKGEDIGGTSDVVHVLKSADSDRFEVRPTDSSSVRKQGSILIGQLAECVAYAWVKGSDYTLVGAERLDPEAIGLPADTEPESVASVVEEQILEGVRELSKWVDQNRTTGRSLTLVTVEAAPEKFSPEAWGRVQL